MSLRARLLAAFAYTLLVVIVALEVPLSANVSDRVNAEVEADSAAQSQVVAASAADQLRNRARLAQITRQAAVSLDGLVFVIDGRGRQIASSAGGITPATSADGRSGRAAGPRRRDRAGPPSRGTRHPLDGRADRPQRPHGWRAGGRAEPECRPRPGPPGRPRADRDRGARAHPRTRRRLDSRRLDRASAALAGRGGPPQGRRRHGGAGAGAQAHASRWRSRASSTRWPTGSTPCSSRSGRSSPTPRTSSALRSPACGFASRPPGVKTSDPAVARELEAAEHETERLEPAGGGPARAGLQRAARRGRPDRPCAAVQAAAERWRGPASESRHEISLEADGEVMVRAGSRELAAILDNLVENAIKYSPSGSPVTIECGERERQRGRRRDQRLGPARRRGGDGTPSSASTGVEAAPPAPAWACRSSWLSPGGAEAGRGSERDRPETGPRRGRPARLRLCQLLTRPSTLIP